MMGHISVFLEKHDVVIGQAILHKRLLSDYTSATTQSVSNCLPSPCPQPVQWKTSTTVKCVAPSETFKSRKGRRKCRPIYMCPSCKQGVTDFGGLISPHLQSICCDQCLRTFTWLGTIPSGVPQRRHLDAGAYSYTHHSWTPLPIRSRIHMQSI